MRYSLGHPLQPGFSRIKHAVVSLIVVSDSHYVSAFCDCDERLAWLQDRNLLLRVTGWFKRVCVRYASFVAIEYWSCALGAVVEMSGLATPGLLRDMGQTKKAEYEGSGGLRHMSCMT